MTITERPQESKFTNPRLGDAPTSATEAGPGPSQRRSPTAKALAVLAITVAAVIAGWR